MKDKNIEPMFVENPKRFVLFPIEHHFWRLEGFSKRKDVEIKQLDTVFPKHMFGYC